MSTCVQVASAALTGESDVVEHLCAAGMDEEKGTLEGSTHLNIAAFSGHLDVVQYLQYLREAGVDTQPSTPVGWTPLHVAAFDGQLDVVHFLWEAGVNKEKAAVRILHFCASFS